MNDSHILWQIVEAGHRITERLESALEPTGLSLAKLNALRYLVEARTPLPLGQLAERIVCVKSNVTQLVDRLENDGLVRRLPDPNDRRSILAAVTDAGRERFRAGATALMRAERELLAEFPEAEQQHIADLLSAIGTASTG
jgi:DNA-binding MarR family transcriptional regulator